MSFDNTYIHCGKAKKMSNKYNVFASLLSAKPEDAGMIAAWMADREAEKDVMNMEVVTCRHDATCLNEARGGYDGNISAGDVRILSKQFTSEPDIIPYVAVLEEWEKGVWLIVPFSHYATPATPGEMSTGIDMHGLRVLQAWNGRTVQTSILKESFLFDRLSDKVREDALALFRHEMGGVDLPTSFSAKRGVSIVNEADPRREYLKECIERLNPLSEAVLKNKEHTSGVNSSVLYAPQEFWRERICQCRDQTMQYRLAAATIDNQKAAILRLENDSSEAFANAYAECELLTPFRPTTKPYNLKFRMTVPDDWKNCKNVAVVVRNADTGALVGEGKLDTSSGIGIVAIKKTDVVVSRASQMVLVTAKEASNEEI